MLLPRFLTALVGVPLLIATIWWGQFPFFILVFGICMLSLYEYYTLAEESSWPVNKKTGLICGALLAGSIFLFGSRSGWAKSAPLEIFFSPAVIPFFLIVLTIGALFHRSKEHAFLGVAITWLGLCYTVWTLVHIFLVRDLRPDGKLYTFFLFLVIWALDIGAYAGGRKFGRNKLALFISPKKTWEGVLVGTGAALLAALLCQQTFLKALKISQALWLGFFIAIFAQLSDLTESLFKRNVQAKDSSNLLPGHGGILDRFDSFLLTAPLYYYVLVLFFVK